MVVQALLTLIPLPGGRDIRDIKNVRDIKNEGMTFSATQVAEAIKKLSEEADGGDTDWATSRRVGRILKRLRLQPERKPGGQRSRQWVTSRSAIISLARAYGLLTNYAEEGSVQADDAEYF